MSTLVRAFQFLQALGGEATKKRLAKHARECDPNDSLSDPRTVSRSMWRLHRSGLVDYEDRDGRGSGKERVWRVKADTPK